MNPKDFTLGFASESFHPTERRKFFMKVDN